MRMHYLQHVPFEDPGHILDWARQSGHSLSAVRMFENDPLPALDHVDWLVIMGGPMNVYQEERFPWLKSEKRYIREALDRGKRILGICLGAQLLADALGAKVYPGSHKEIGWFPVEKTDRASISPVGKLLPGSLEAFHWHGDTFELPTGAVHLARSRACEHQAFSYGERVVGLQFHLEMTCSGVKRLIAHCSDDLDNSTYVQDAGMMLSEERRFGRMVPLMRRLLTFMDRGDEPAR